LGWGEAKRFCNSKFSQEKIRNNKSQKYPEIEKAKSKKRSKFLLFEKAGEIGRNRG